MTEPLKPDPVQVANTERQRHALAKAETLLESSELAHEREIALCCHEVYLEVVARNGLTGMLQKYREDIYKASILLAEDGERIYAHCLYKLVTNHTDLTSDGLPHPINFVERTPSECT